MEHRYSRQTVLKNVGQGGQIAIKESSVLVVGCGGLGSVVAMYLCRAGIGTLGLVDHDRVQLSNLHRQVLFNENDVGEWKVDATKRALVAANSDVKVQTFNMKLTDENTEAVFSEFDFIVDGTDNFETKYLVNDACVLFNKTLIYGSVNQFDGQVALFNHNGSGNLRDLFPQMPNSNLFQNCEEAGVLGPMVGIVGSIMAMEVLKVIAQTGETLANKLLLLDGLSYQNRKMNYRPKGNVLIKKLPKNNSSCSTGKMISWHEYHTEYKDFMLVDVRTSEERLAGHSGGLHLPLPELESRINELTGYPKIAFYCQSGERAKKAAIILSTFPNIEIVSIQ
ncbi:MAG: ThiF family adenylyltransferase [Flavobacteriales bacterium]|nr:ThiF family adenylyltransferase [Flavobacteriales bacterium]